MKNGIEIMCSVSCIFLLGCSIKLLLDSGHLARGAFELGLFGICCMSFCISIIIYSLIANRKIKNPGKR